MIDDGLAYLHDYQEQPPRVKYGLAELVRDIKRGKLHFTGIKKTITKNLIGQGTRFVPDYEVVALARIFFMYLVNTF